MTLIFITIIILLRRVTLKLSLLLCCVTLKIPNYYKIIVNPMDLATIRSRLSRVHFNHYQIIEEFVADVQLIFSNCATFNPVCCADFALVLNHFLVFRILY